MAAARLLEAIGIAAPMIELVQGICGDAWGELYLSRGGIVAFVIGRGREKGTAPPPVAGNEVGMDNKI